MNTANIKQYEELKTKYPTAILFFRCGDFYEIYNDDAKVCAKELGLTIVTEDGLFCSSFPHHALDVYLPKMVRKGHRIAICDILEAPKPKKTMTISEMVAPKKRSIPVQLELNFND